MEQLTDEGVGRDVTSAARRKVEQMMTGVKERAGEVMTGVKDRASELRTRSIDDLWHGTVEYIRDNPGKTIIVSMGIGLLIGSLLRRRGD